MPRFGGDPPIDWSRPTPAGDRAVADIHHRLRLAGVPEGPTGYDLAALEVAVTLLAWTSDAGPARAGDAAPFLAVVGLCTDLVNKAYIAWGWSEAVALARALDHALMLQGGSPFQH